MNLCYKFVTLLVLGYVVGISCLTEDEITPCEDEYLDCAARVVKGEPCLGLHQKEGERDLQFDFDLGARLMSRCRVSCRLHLKRQIQLGNLNETMLELLRRYGGTDDVMVTVFGAKISFCDLSKGWYAEAREFFLDRRFKANATFMNTRMGPRRYTEQGFKKSKIPKEAWKALKEMYSNLTQDYKPGTTTIATNPLKLNKNETPCTLNDLGAKCNAPGVYACRPVKIDSAECMYQNETATFMSLVSTASAERLASLLLPYARRWSGERLVLNNVYGFRRYFKGGKMEGHVDRNKLVISAIINVAQDVDGHPWPLNIFDHSGKQHRVFMEPGELVWLESAKVPHGRAEIFQGNYYDNIFVHFKPAWYLHATEDEIMYPHKHNMGRTKYDIDR